MRKYQLLFLALLASPSLFAQKGSVAANIFDTLLSKPVSDATISVLRQKDSALVSFSMSNNSGYFQVSKLAPGDYRLLVTHVAYHNASVRFSITDSVPDLHLGNIPVFDRSTTLQEVIVSSEAPPVTLVGDTVQYHADAFKTQPNANVEQLLKKLPGVQVERDGTVKANGQTVKRVLVDGREFFGNDPKMATKNLPADAIDKVQVYDRASDQSQLTGFDDGNSEKTINLKLKKDKTKGLFGKANAGVGTEGRKEGRFNLNSFKGARQFSAIGTANNTNTEGFSFSDLLSFSGEMGRMMRGAGNAASVDQASAASSSATNQGIRTIWGAGLNYNNIIGTKTDFTSNYFYNHYNPQTLTDTRRTYLLPDSSYQYEQRAINDVRNNSHRINLGFDHRLDSFHSIRINPSFGFQRTGTSSLADYEQRGSDGRLSNLGFNNYERNSEAVNFKTDFLLRKKFRKKGRTFSISGQTLINTSDADGEQQSVNEFFAIGGLSRRDSINQRSLDQSEQRSITARAVYTEPLWKRSLLELSAGKSYNSSTSARQAFDFNKSSGGYDLKNDSLSNDFETEYGYHNAGIRIRSQRQKFNYSVGLTWQQASLRGRVLAGEKDASIAKDFDNLLPNARLVYNFMRSKTLTVNYLTSTQQPSVSQLQPVPDISNRLNIYEGNPDLRQEYNHTVQLNYVGVNPFKQRSFFAFFNLGRTDNKIVNSDSIFDNGVKKTRPVNTDAVYQLTGDLSLGLPARFVKGLFQFGVRSSFNRGKQFVNGEGNLIDAFTVGPRTSLTMNPTEKIELVLGTTFNFNRTTYSLQPNFNTNYFSQIIETEFNWQLPGSFFFNTEFTYTRNNQLAEGFNLDIPLWNMSLSKQFLKLKRGELKLRVNDLLNKNVAVNRTSNQSFIEDRRVNTLRRYAMLSFTYSLNKSGGNAMPGRMGGNGVMIQTR